MHVGAISIFEGGALFRADGGIDFARIRRLAAPGIGRHPRFRQRLEHVPLIGHPVWVDDAHFQPRLPPAPHRTPRGRVTSAS